MNNRIQKWIKNGQLEITEIGMAYIEIAKRLNCSHRRIEYILTKKTRPSGRRIIICVD